MTDFFIKCQILGDLYGNYEEDFKDFIEFNDLGFPLAYLNAQGLALPSSDGMRFVEETWDLLLAELNVEDIGFEDLSHLLTFSE
jgi:hypothetical protein